MSRMPRTLIICLGLLAGISVIAAWIAPNRHWRQLPRKPVSKVTVHGAALDMTRNEVQAEWNLERENPETSNQRTVTLPLDWPSLKSLASAEVNANGKVDRVDGFQVETETGILMRFGDMVSYDELEPTLGPSHIQQYQQRSGIVGLRFDAPSFLMIGADISGFWRKSESPSQDDLRGHWVRILSIRIQAPPKSERNGL